ncbi:MAG: chorismate mutase [Gammaproteobacteria bacterium]
MVTVYQNTELENLHIIRRKIDRLDAHLILLLKLRSHLVAKAQETKHNIGLPSRSHEREQQILTRGADLAKRNGLNPDAVCSVLSSVLQNSLRMTHTPDCHQRERLMRVDR